MGENSILGEVKVLKTQIFVKGYLVEGQSRYLLSFLPCHH